MKLVGFSYSFFDRESDCVAGWVVIPRSIWSLVFMWAVGALTGALFVGLCWYARATQTPKQAEASPASRPITAQYNAVVLEARASLENIRICHSCSAATLGAESLSRLASHLINSSSDMALRALSASSSRALFISAVLKRSPKMRVMSFASNSTPIG